VTVRRSPVNADTRYVLDADETMLGLLWDGEEGWQGGFAFRPRPAQCCFRRLPGRFVDERAALDGLLGAIAELPAAEQP